MSGIERSRFGSTKTDTSVDAQNHAEWVAENMPAMRAGRLGSHPDSNVVASVVSRCGCSACETAHARVQSSATLARAGHFNWYSSLLSGDSQSRQNQISQLMEPLKQSVAATASGSSMSQRDAANAVSDTISKWSNLAASYSTQPASPGAEADMKGADPQALASALEVSVQSSAINRAMTESSLAAYGNPSQQAWLNSSPVTMSDEAQNVHDTVAGTLKSAGVGESQATTLASELVASTHMAATISKADPTQGGDGVRLRNSVDNVGAIVSAALSQLPPGTLPQTNDVADKLSATLGAYHAATRSIVADTLTTSMVQTQIQRNYESEVAENPLTPSNSDRAREQRHKIRNKDHAEHDRDFRDQIERARGSTLLDH